MIKAHLRHEHSEVEIEADRIEFYRRFEKDQPHLTYEPTYEEEEVKNVNSPRKTSA